MESGTRPIDVLQFLHICGKLKTEKRTGWINNNVFAPESICDHMYRMGIMSFLIDDPNIDRTKCIKIALVHDMAEALVGDITPFQGVAKEEKHKRELNAMTKVKETLGGFMGDEFFNLWNEYEEGSTAEARIVKQLDKLEMIVQADEYEKDQQLDLSSFFDWTEKYHFSSTQVKSWVDELYRQRQERRKQADAREIQKCTGYS